MLALAMVLAVSLKAPFWLGYFASRPAMDNVAHSVMNRKSDPSKIHWIGVYPVDWAWGDGAGFEFAVSGTEDPSYAYFKHGFGYTSDPHKFFGCGALPTHVEGHWYQFVENDCGA
jgi:hypothetical protein